MNIKQLRLFHEVLSTGKMSRAAERLHFSQPAASKMLHNLEDRIGYKLFFRQNGQLNPTPEALYLHDEVMTILRSVKRLEDSFERAKYGQLGRLNIASILGPSYSFLPAIFNGYAGENSDLKLNLQVHNSRTIRDSVSSGQFELGLVDQAAPSHSYDSEVFDLPCFCALHKDHPAAKYEILTPELLDKEVWITLDPEHITYQSLSSHYQAAGAKFVPKIEVNATLHALPFVQSNRGIALIDAINFHHFNNVHSLEDIIFRRFCPEIREPLELISINSRPLSKPASDIRKRLISELKALCCSTQD
ncbi:LysR family transcriptional regulator [Marinobacter santoriniensis NKSG1]|uniref:LysR family transcriptional regulator n=1 Tax=Marinobacter santoriniensis NKSG1 TaxID=1288826 RepID=M7DH02_9GAMM|nr:LysR family transcriptional regulator [Marinobacter santoriniensis]EMP56942.1 LysR family transcriptional regulator [Marinobacter santoriniensis NKSG1]